MPRVASKNGISDTLCHSILHPLVRGKIRKLYYVVYYVVYFILHKCWEFPNVPVQPVGNFPTFLQPDSR